MYVLILVLATCMHLEMAVAFYVVQVSTLVMEAAQQLVHSDNIQIKLLKPASLATLTANHVMDLFPRTAPAAKILQEIHIFY